jgi:uncharacterized membrane protein YciS (DUF1049 family)
MKGTNKQGQRGARRQIVKNKQHLKKVAIAVILASVGLVVYTLVAGYTYQAKQKVELQNSLRQLQTQQQQSAEDKKKIEELTRQLQAKREAATALAEAQAQEQKAVVTRVQAPRAYSGSHSDWMSAAGIPSSEWGCTDYIISRESGWRVDAYNPNGGATGLPQALPGSKMASAGADWQTNPVTQLRWYYGYVNARYGSPCGAYNFWQTHHWY